MQSFGGCSTNCSFNITLVCVANLSSVMVIHGFSDLIEGFMKLGLKIMNDLYLT